MWNYVEVWGHFDKYWTDDALEFEALELTK